MWLRGRPKRTVVLPPQGRALVLSDLHGHRGDWESFLRVSRIKERLREGEDVYLLLTGDVPDVARHRTVDPSVPPDGDVSILEELIALRAELGSRANRVIYLEGNHDFHLSRIAREITGFHEMRRGRKTGRGEPPSFTPDELQAYLDYYRESFGEQIYENNISPYDMIRRLRPEHLTFLESCPILAVCEGAGVAVTHAGPPRMADWPKPQALKRAIESADRAQLREFTPPKYYDSPYHQLLNNRFRNGDYTLSDLNAFVAAFGVGVLVTGHTPHPYLVDFERGEPLHDCAFHDGLGFIGQHQVVLCSSFGAFHPSLKRYLEFDLSRRYDNVQSLTQDPDVCRPVFPRGQTPPDVSPLPGAEVVLGGRRGTN